VDSPLSNCSNTPVEALDSEHAFLRVIANQLEPDSFGHGAQRGGAGFSRHYQILADDVKLELYADRFRLQPAGLFGGTPARVGHCVVRRGERAMPVASKSSTWLKKGDVVELFCGGGAGFGEPSARARDAIRRDLQSGLLSRDEALSVYGYRA